MKKNFIFLFALVVVTGVFVQNAQAQTIWYVTSTGAGSFTGTDWTNAYADLQSALNSANSGDEIWVAKGTYKPSVEVGGSGTRYQTFQMVNGVAIYGGFAGTETTISQRTDFARGQANETILSGDIGTAAHKLDNCYHVFYHPDGLVLSSTAILDGFTITYGYASGSTVPFNKGGGMYNGNSSSPAINNCTFDLNYASISGGGMANVGAELTVTSPTVTNCTFVLNSAMGNYAGGGGMYNSYSSPTVTNCLFTSNRGQTLNYCSGAGIFNYYSSPILNNCTFSKNNFIHLGGAISNSYSSPTINNCIIWGNAAVSYGNEFYVSGNSSNITTLNNSCYRTGTDAYGVVAVYIGGTAKFTLNNSITTDPQFVDATLGNYRIYGVSPCVDAGNDSYNSESYDIRGIGYARKLDNAGGVGTIDIGAYEYQLGVDPLPVELIRFTASVAKNNVTLYWQTATEVNNYGFEIERAINNGQLIIDNWSKMGFVQGNGTTNAPKEYSYTDKATTSGKYSYRLKQIDRDGKFTYSQSVEVTISGTPTVFALDQNYPNPFNPTTAISYQLSANGMTTLIVYDAIGREVATLVNEVKEAGTYSASFDGSKLSSGMYFARLSSAGKSQIRKLLLMK